MQALVAVVQGVAWKLQGTVAAVQRAVGMVQGVVKAARMVPVTQALHQLPCPAKSVQLLVPSGSLAGQIERLCEPNLDYGLCV